MLVQHPNTVLTILISQILKIEFQGVTTTSFSPTVKTPKNPQRRIIYRLSLTYIYLLLHLERERERDGGRVGAKGEAIGLQSEGDV